MEKTIVELFAGVGGFRLGFEKASDEWKTVWFSQWEPEQKAQWAYNCYVSHWPEPSNLNSNIDISKVKKDSIPNHNILVGGFPCQDYSVARPLSDSNGIRGKKGVLWWQIYETVKNKTPAFILLENVDRLLKSPASQRGRDFGIILFCLNELGYDIEWRVINAADYGGAQRRRRIFIFAWNRNTRYAKNILDCPSQIIKGKGFFAKAFPIKAIFADINGSILEENIYSISAKFKFQFENCGICKAGKIFSAKAEPKVEPFIPIKNILQFNVDRKYYIDENRVKWEYLKGSKNEFRKHKNGHEYKYTEGAIAFPDSLDKPGRTMLTSESTVNRSSHVVTDLQTGQIRKITPIEAERMQGFDDDWTNTGMTERARYFCMGNALVVPMVERMAHTLGEIVDAE